MFVMAMVLDVLSLASYIPWVAQMVSTVQDEEAHRGGAAISSHIHKRGKKRRRRTRRRRMTTKTLSTMVL